VVKKPFVTKMMEHFVLGKVKIEKNMHIPIRSIPVPCAFTKKTVDKKGPDAMLYFMMD